MARVEFDSEVTHHVLYATDIGPPARMGPRTSNRGSGYTVRSIQRRVLAMAALGLALGGSPGLVAAGDDLPGKVVHSWLANSFARTQGHQSVPVSVCGIGVTPDGTVFSAGVAEGYGGVASYKDGRFVTKYDYDSGFGSSASAVAADDEYVYIGTAVGLFRTRRGDEGYNRTPAVRGQYPGRGPPRRRTLRERLRRRQGPRAGDGDDEGGPLLPRPEPRSAHRRRRRPGLGHPGQARQGALPVVLHGRPQGRLLLQGRQARPGDRGLREPLRADGGPEGPSPGGRAEPARSGLDLRRLGAAEEGGHVRRGGRHLLRRAGAIRAEEVPLDPRPGVRRGRQPLRRQRLRHLVQRLDRGLFPLGRTTLGRPRPGQLAGHGLHRPGRRERRLHQGERLRDGLEPRRPAASSRWPGSRSIASSTRATTAWWKATAPAIA